MITNKIATPQTDIVQLAQQLIQQPSVTPDDKDCQAIIAAYLSRLGFQITHLPDHDTQNLWAYRPSNHKQQQDLFIFAGHTDVVPPGPVAQWTYPPFAAEIHGQQLHGRGSVDMKSALAAMLVSTKQFLDHTPEPDFALGFMITSDEEGQALHGTKSICQHLLAQQLQPNYCIVGEPSAINHTGDQIRIGRRGSLSANMTIHGKQGHVAYPDQAENAISIASKIITVLDNTPWDQGNADFPATRLQCTHITSDTAVSNVIPGIVNLAMNLRFSPELSAQQLKTRISQLVKSIHPKVDINWQHSGDPFYTKPDCHLIHLAQQTIKQQTKQQVQLSTGGGTSDGRFIKQAFPEIELIECGLPNKTIHAVNEHCDIKQLVILAEIYQAILKNFSTPICQG